MDGYDSNDPIFVEDVPTPEGRIPKIRRYKWISPNYFQTMGNRLVAGHDLSWSELHARTPVVIVSENLAREYWKEPAQAIGRRIRNTPNHPWRTIIGVYADAYDDGVSRPAPGIVYWPMLVDRMWNEPTTIQRTMAYAIRSERADSPTLLKEVQQAVWAVNGNLPVATVRTLNEIRSESMAQTSFALVMLTIAASVALLLGIVGIYGVISYIAVQRTREIGIRLALGAARRDVSALFLRHGLTLTGIGLVVGIGAAAGLSRFISTLLFGVSELDWTTYLGAAVSLGVTALLASYLPALRAARTDPATALRYDI